MGAITVQVITPERTVIKELTTDAVVIPVVDGSMGILKNHAPMVAALRTGLLKYRNEEGQYERIALSGGFAEFSDNQLTVLAETAERAADIDVLRARQALARAKARLRQWQSNVDFSRAQASLQRALNRLRAAEQEAQGKR